MVRAAGWILALLAVFGILTAIAARTGSAPVTAAPSVVTVASASPVPARTAMPVAGSAGPTETQELVCSNDLREIVQQVLALKTRPKPHAGYAGGLYTCDYDLPAGRMRVSVQHSPTDAAAMAYLKARSHAVHATQVLAGLGEAGYGTGNGVVLTVKDNETLEVDTTAMPAVFGAEGQRRSDLAYEIASDVLGCWVDDAS